MGEKFYSKASEMQNPFALYQAVRRRFSATAILESLGEYDESLARYTILGVIAQQMLYEQEHQVFVKDMRSGEEVLTEDWGSVLDEWCGPLGRSASPFQTGVIGYIGYENNRRFEKLPVTPQSLALCRSCFWCGIRCCSYMIARKNVASGWGTSRCRMH